MTKSLKLFLVGLFCLLALLAATYTRSHWSGPRELFHTRFVLGYAGSAGLGLIALGLWFFPPAARRVPGPQRAKSLPHLRTGEWIVVVAAHPEAKFRFPQLCVCCGAPEVSWHAPIPELAILQEPGQELARELLPLPVSLLLPRLVAPEPPHDLPFCHPCRRPSLIRGVAKFVLPCTWAAITLLGALVVFVGKVGNASTLGLTSLAVATALAALWWLVWQRSPCDAGLRGALLQASREGPWELSFKVRHPGFAREFLALNEHSRVL